MEEERRLCYVAITRAKKKLHICYARQRMLYGRTSSSLASRFLREIPEHMTVKKGSFHTAQAYGGYMVREPIRTPVSKAEQKTDYTSAYSVSTSKPSYLELKKGDMVSHTAFGKGMVLTVMKLGNDALLEIAFDQIGTKKLMAKTASAHMKKL
jgi:DNA helicase-2/ATP-dependent DNA helicase PcrA